MASTRSPRGQPAELSQNLAVIRFAASGFAVGAAMPYRRNHGVIWRAEPAARASTMISSHQVIVHRAQVGGSGRHHNRDRVLDLDIKSSPSTKAFDHLGPSGHFPGRPDFLGPILEIDVSH